MPTLKRLPLYLTLAATIALTGPPPPAHAGALKGAVIGAGVGAVVGGKKGARNGAIVGAIVGGTKKNRRRR